MTLGLLELTATPSAAGPDACTTVANFATCTGNQSAGVASGTDFTAPPVNTLNVNNLTQAIAPAAGVDGIVFTSAGSITINSDVTPFAINSTANGINAATADAAGATSNVTVTSTGDITATNIAIRAVSGKSTTSGKTGDAAVTSNGNLGGTNLFAGVFAVSGDSTGGNTGTVSVTSTGNINADLGIEALSGKAGGASGNVTVTSTGTLTGTITAASGDATANSGSVSVVTSIGNTAGILAASGKSATAGTGSVTVTNTGDINSINTAISAASGGSTTNGNTGDVTVTSTGNLIGTNSFGISAVSFSSFAGGNTGAVQVTSIGAISSSNAAIFAFSGGSTVGSAHTGSVTVTSTGDINSHIGIIAASGDAGGVSGEVSVTSTGNVTGTIAAASGSANGDTGNVAITSIGNTGGLDAVSGNSKTTATGTAAVTNTGDVTATNTALRALSGSSTTNGNTGDATVTSAGNLNGAKIFGIVAGSGSSFGSGNTGDVHVTSNGAINITGSAISAASGGSTSGNTGNVTVTSTGNINAGLAGIDAQSLHAGGTSGNVTVISTGNITVPSDAISATSGGANGATGNVSITSVGDITAKRGIVATSGSSATVAPGNIDVSTTGNITASAIGILATAGGVTPGNVTVSISGGTVSGATGGVHFNSNGNNTLTVNAGAGVAAASGLAVFGFSGNETINNFGTVTGNVDVGGGTNAFFNMVGGLFNAGPMINLGGANALTNAGTLSPGGIGAAQLSTLTGNYVQTGTGAYAVDVAATADRLNVTGTAKLAGAVNVAIAPGPLALHYTILSAAGGLGGTTFNARTTNNSNFNAGLSYTSTDVLLNLTATLGLQQALTVNQQNVANPINGFFNGGGTLPPGFGTLFGLTGGNLANALSQLSGEVATGSQQTTFDAMNLFMSLLTDPFIAGRGDGVSGGAGATPFAEESDGANAYAAKDKPRSKSERDAYAAIYRKAPPPALDPFAQRWSVWAAGYGGSQTTDGNAVPGSNTATGRIAGVAVGADYRFSPSTLAGFALAGGGTNFSIANALGSGRSDLFQAGAYLRHTAGPAYISAALAYGWQDITTDRTVTIAGVDQLRARFNANAFSGRAEGGYRFLTSWMGVTPYAAAQFTTFDLPAYAERALVGANTFALAYGAKDVTATRSELGVRTDKSWAMQSSIFTLRGRFAWAHDYNADRNIGATFQTLPGASFVVNGAAQAHDAALATASAEVKWLNGWSAAATFEGEFSNVTRSYAGKGVVRYAW